MATSSDFNALSRTTSNVGKSRVYVDFDIRMIKNPNTRDIVPLTDIEAVRMSVKRLVLTNFYERPFQPFLGGHLSAQLFELGGPITAYAIESEILRVIEEYEPRVNKVVCTVNDDLERNSYDVSVNFNVAAINTSAEINFALTRIR